MKTQLPNNTNTNKLDRCHQPVFPWLATTIAMDSHWCSKHRNRDLNKNSRIYRCVFSSPWAKRAWQSVVYLLPVLIWNYLSCHSFCLCLKAWDSSLFRLKICFVFAQPACWPPAISIKQLIVFIIRQMTYENVVNVLVNWLDKYTPKGIFTDMTHNFGHGWFYYNTL